MRIRTFLQTLLFFSLLLSFVSCSQSPEPLKQALNTITVEDLVKHVKVLASDEFMGRFPASKGEELTLNYLQNEFKRIGLKPGNSDSFFQPVPLVEMTINTDIKMSVSGKTGKLVLYYGKQFVASTSQVVEHLSLEDKELVFAGYGIVAPEYKWNDYAGIDVKDKIVIVLINDPGHVTGNKQLFKGTALTYYGRPDYKIEEATRQGAAGVLIVHDRKAAGYPWNSDRYARPRPKFYIENPDKNMSHCALQGWITNETTGALFKLAGRAAGNLFDAAAKPGYKTKEFSLTVSLELDNKLRHTTSSNALAMIPGSKRPDEIIVFIAHWDHLGVDPNLEGDKIYNGAADNAIGVACLLELAEALTHLPEPPERSILFLMTTCEEAGRLGSEYYSAHPPFPLQKTVAAINIDGVTLIGKMKDVIIIGYGLSQLDDILKQEAKILNRFVSPDQHLERGYFFRLDHINFAKVGVPAIHIGMGTELLNKDKVQTAKEMSKAIGRYYHKPGDEYDPSWWNLTSTVDDLHLIFRMTHRLASQSTFPKWNKNSKFQR